jgi:hypothetical protein
MGKEGKNLYLNLNTSGLLQAFFDVFKAGDLGRTFNPQYHYEKGNYDNGKIIDWQTGEELIVVGEPQQKGTREVKILVQGKEGETVLDNFMEICNRRGVEVYPF